LEHPGPILEVAYRPDGHAFLTAATDGRVRIFDSRTAQLLAPALDHGAPVEHARFSADGRRVFASSRTTGCATIWSDATGQPEGERLDFGRAVTQVAFSPDGKRWPVSDREGGGGLAYHW
jgi:WD40 repeat protein